MTLPRFLNREIIISLLVASFPILCLAYGKGYNLPPILLLVAALGFCWQFNTINYTKQVKWVLGSFGIYFLTYLASTLYYGVSFSEIDMPSRIVLVLPIFLLLLLYPPKINILTSGFIIGSIITGIVAMIHIYDFKTGRAFSDVLKNIHPSLKGYMPIQSGNMAMTLGLISLTISINYLIQKSWWRFTFSLIAAFLGIYASFLSGARGGWVFLPLAVVYLAFSNRRLITKKIALVSILVLGTAVFSLSQNKEITTRLNSAMNQVIQYQKGHDENSSLGVRFELWKSAIYTTEQHPIIGAGYQVREVLREKWAHEGLVNSQVIKNFLDSHSHNQFLEDLSVRGVIGLTALLAIFIIPLGIFIVNHRIANSPQQKMINQCGAISVIMMIGYCLSQAMFRHNSGIIFYSLMTVILLATSISMREKQS
ncbi:RfaL protein [Photobacterium sp. SKA34]|uniref:O-antigen ligase family protein n=1 Tax=Photobacterium sp. SKA34 TaxID=121723 RepID=UPI00006ADD7E|nr:O-antigen ligase family protein [Photobacterium sp. SKA34]EAR53534.1 RfaL protein [Photobacterium sp. SKA34]